MDTATVLSITLFLVTTDLCLSAPQHHDATGGFLPSPSSYFLQSGDQIAMESEERNQTAPQDRIDDKKDLAAESVNDVDQRNVEPRFGFLSYGTTTTIQNTGTTGLGGVNGQLKLDLGGVVLGAIIGFGAVFILPKIIHVFSAGQDSDFGGGIGGYGYRSENEKQTGIMDILSRIDETLAQYNIDSSSCMQRAVCSYVKMASDKVTDGSASNLDALIDSASGNSIVNFMLDGTSIKQAVEMGRSGGNCGATYARCPFTKESLFAALKSLMTDQN